MTSRSLTTRALPPSPLAGHPANRRAATGFDKRLGIFLGQAARPFLESLFGELSTFGMGILQ